ncbi:hypothetical protein F1599_04385 [Cupriavidus cauae]|uniref:ChsH2 rubredoxin-like zinc ribbon domain-containing protein n=1 Tax=Cupriavidus cauae TaxID=2608999 RepID=A0A5M8B595_9BURK|nr:hypothetical protein F1599_04385 [Cupriavidus cauae]
MRPVTAQRCRSTGAVRHDRRDACPYTRAIR